MVINNTPFPAKLDHQELIRINRNGNEISTINFNTNYASSIGAKIVNQLKKGSIKRQIIHFISVN